MATQKKSKEKEAHSRVISDIADMSNREAIAPGNTVRVHQILVEKTSKGEEKKRIQMFEGIVLGRKHGNEAGATITVRKIASGVGVEKIFPVHSPWIAKIEIVKTAKVRRAKLNYLRSYSKRLKEKTVA